MPADRRPPTPLNRDSLDRLALRYVERYATTRSRFAAYLDRKVRERGWEGPAVDTDALARRFADLGYIDDRAFAEARVRSLSRRGLGRQRIAMAFRAAGIDAADTEDLAPDIAARALESALTLARRKRIGPFADQPGDRAKRERQLAAMLRGGHGFALARRIVTMEPGDDLAQLRDD